MASIILKICNFHGLTQYYVYKGKPNKCIICAKEKAMMWRNSSDENMKKHLSGVKKWRSQNPDRIEELRDKHSAIQTEKRRANAKNKSDLFYSKFGDLVESIRNKLDLKKIPKKLHRIDNPDKYNILEFLINAKEQEILKYERGRLHTIYTWKVLKNKTSKGASQEQLDKISKYKEEAERIAEIKMKNLIKNIRI